MTAEEAERIEVARRLREMADGVERGEILTFSDLCWAKGELRGNVQVAGRLDWVVLTVR